MNHRKEMPILPPDLPPELSEDDIDVSDEDFEFIPQNRDYVDLFSSLDPKILNKHVNRVADIKEDQLEAVHEKRCLHKALLETKTKKPAAPVDSLPIKTLDGTVQYITVGIGKQPQAETSESDPYGGEVDDNIVKLSKAERRVMLKRSKKEVKKKGKENEKKEMKAPAAALSDVLAEVKADLSAEELKENKKCRLAELGMALLADPESNIKLLKEMLLLSKDSDSEIVKLGLLSLLAVFRDIIPGYRIRLPTDKELKTKVSKVVTKTQFYESTLLSAFKAYLQRLITLEQEPSFHHRVIRCLCSLLEAVPHFNFRGILIKSVVENIASADDVVRKLCCAAIKSLFTNEGKHNGEATVEAVRHIANLVKINNCILHPDSIEVFLSLTFDEDLRTPKLSKDDKKPKVKRNRRIRHSKEQNQLPQKDKKRTKKEMMFKMKQEVDSDFKAASFSTDVDERKRMQSDTLSAVFQTYFRILKHTVLSETSRCVHGNVRLQVGRLLNIEEVSKHSKYLGLPLIVGQNKREIFRFVEETCHKRISDWKSKLLSIAGRETLIKAVIQAIPLYSMSCYKLPLATCKKLVQTLTQFWWSNTNSTKPIHWIRRKVLFDGKEVGGLGLRCPVAMNDALLLNQAWRIMAEPNLLVSKIFKARYFHTSDLLDAGLGSSPSHAWRGLSKIKPYLRKGLETVEGESRPLWTLSSSGEFTTRSAYQLIKKSSAELTGGETSDSASQSYFWKRFWNIKLPSKIKVFGWRLYHDGLPDSVNLRSRGVQCSLECSFCGWVAEDACHLFRDCWRARAVGEALLVPSRAYLLEGGTPADWLWWCAKELSSEEFRLLLCASWCIWACRNELRFDKPGWNVDSSVAKVQSLISQWDKYAGISANICLWTGKREAGDLVFCDCSWTSFRSITGMAAVYLQDNVVQAVAAVSRQGIKSPRDAE